MILAERRPAGRIIDPIRNAWVSDSLRGRFARGAVWSLFGAILSQGSTLAASVIAARLLGKEAFGKFGMVQSTIGMLGIFAGLGLGVTTTKYVAELRMRDKERVGRIIALGSTVAAVFGGMLALGLLLSAPLLAIRSLNDPSLAIGLRIGCAMLFFNAFNGAQIGALSGFEAFRFIARINLVRGLIGLPLTAVGVYFWKVPGALWAVVIASASACLMSQMILQDQCAAFGIRVRLWSAWSERRVLWTFSTPAFLSGALVGPIIWVGNTILVNQPGGYAEMGVLSAANQWRNAVGFIPGVLGQFALPLLANLNGERDGIRYGKALRWNLIIATAAASLAALPVMLIAPPIMRLYGRSFENGVWVLVVSAAAAVVSAMNSVVGTAITSSGSVWLGLVFNAMWAGVFLVGCYYLIPSHLALGFAVSLLGAYLAHTAWQSVYMWRRLNRQ